MANVFQPVGVVLQRMCDNYKAITGVTLDPTNLDDSTLIKMMTNAGAVSAFTSQVQGAYNDFFPSSASEPGLEQHLATRVLPPRIDAQAAIGQIQLSATPGTVLPAGASVTRTSDGSTFTSIQDGTADASGNLIVYFQADEPGAAGNLAAAGNPFTLSTPPAGVQAACTNFTPFLDGRDQETPAEMFQRILDHDQDADSGGNLVAYQTWAREASPAVVSAITVARLRGPDTVDTYITSGTTDIAAAVAAGLPVTRIPSAALIAAVQAYIVGLNPVTDVHQTNAPTEVPFNLSVQYSLYNESVQLRAYVDAQILQVAQIYLYSAPTNSKITPSALERLIDQAVGDLLEQRVVANFAGATPAYVIPVGQILKPGTISIGPL